MIRFLSLLRGRDRTIEERQKLIEEEYHIAMTDDLVEGVRTVCNYSEAIEMRGELKGLEKGRQEGFQLLGALITRLMDLGRMEDVTRVTKDPAYRDKLISEFQPA